MQERESTTAFETARFKFLLGVLKTVRHLFVTVKWLGVAYFFYLSVDALAGKTTILSTVFKYVIEAKFSVVLPWLLAVAALVWGVLERLLRRRKTAGMQEHIRRLETSLDPERTGSNLLPDGRTNPKDRLDVDS